MTQSLPKADPHPQRGTTETSARRHANEKLDEALKATFPASDPFALTLDPFALPLDEDPNSRATYASPPCFMHELDPAYLGLAPDRELRPADHDEPEATTPKDADSK
jgi:hypothetical protein